MSAVYVCLDSLESSYCVSVGWWVSVVIKSIMGLIG